MTVITPFLPFEVSAGEAPLAEWFAEYDERNPQVWAAFERLTLEMVQRGHRLGAKAVAERMRWEALVEQGRDGFRVNNTAVSFLARKFHAAHPELGEVFELRQQAQEGAA